MHCFELLVLQGQMWPFVVMNHCLIRYHLPGLRQVGRLVQQELCLKNAVDPFCQRILVAVISIRHRTRQSMTLMQHLIRHCTVPPPSSLMHQWRSPLSAALYVFQRLGQFLGVQRHLLTARLSADAEVTTSAGEW